MENYTKYKLKSSDELASVLNGRDNLFVIACNKCFKEFETVDEPDCEEFLKFAAEQGKTVTGSAKFDFLCNKMHTERKLQDLLPEGTENVVVISCGLGIQTVADLTGKPVIAASNTLNYRGHHGMALTKKSCDACAQCYLNITGGVCPIVDCSKSLVNGQCGGAKNGKCEVDPNKDCAWEKIYQRLAKQGRLEEFLNQPVQVRDYSKVNFKVINDYVKSIREDRLNGYYGGVHPSEHKEFSEHIDLKKFPDPKTVVISMSQHLGAPANPIVEVGDTVKVGQKRRAEHPDYTGKEEFNFFLSVVFPYDQLTILPYHRIVKDIKGMEPKAFIGSMKFNFELMAMPGFPCKPVEKHCFGLYVDGEWFHLKAYPDIYAGKDSVGQLDVSILQDKVLGPVLGISDPRTDERIRFMGGNHRLKDLAAAADETGGAAFAMYPTSIEELMTIADEGKLMPPKSTWFEPKLRSGLFIHKLSD